jgi:transforming growth factor-beta-induced protein
MKQFSKLLLVLALLLAAVPAVLAQDEAPFVPENSISGIAFDQSNLSTLGAAIEAAGLTEMFSGGEWTLFAPRDRAFAKMGLNAGNITDSYSSEELRDLILYHTLSGRKSTADLKTMLGDVTMQNGGLAGLKWYRNRIYVNDDSRVTGPNNPADNGYIHIVDTVVQPPWPRVAAEETSEGQVQESAEGQVQTVTEGQVQEATEGQVQTVTEGQVQSTEDQVPAVPENSIAGIAAADGRFETLAAAAAAAGMLDELGGGEWTLFAPTDDAFAKMGLNADNVASEFSAAELADLLRYHLLSGNYSTGALKAILGDVTMANGNLAGLKYYEGDIYVNDDSKVVQADITADNGVFHAVDTVVLPPWPRPAAIMDLTEGQVQGQVQEAMEGQVQ